MKKFDVEITETLQRKVSVEAASQEDAERMVTQAWNNQDYVLDSGDFTGVDFKTVGEHELAETRTMDVLLVQPNAYPKKISVGTELEDLQAMVGGDIEVTYPFEDEVAIILNESGKINGLPLNRAIYTEDGDMQDIYAGDFLVVGLTEDDFGSLTSEQMQKFEEQLICTTLLIPEATAHLTALIIRRLGMTWLRWMNWLCWMAESAFCSCAVSGRSSQINTI